MPLIAILRGVKAHEAVSIATTLAASGFACVEVPLSSLEALDSIERMRVACADQLLIGAGTVLSAAQVSAARAAGAQFIVSPSANASVIESAKSQGLAAIPGFLTPTEAFTAIAAGADALKLFPADVATPAMLRSLKAILPDAIPVLPVGGITPSCMSAWVNAGAAGFGIGSALYTAGADAMQVKKRAVAFVDAWQVSRCLGAAGRNACVPHIKLESP
jgi:2-dehydro-3-deoxyphosphogalactonate aldolase